MVMSRQEKGQLRLENTSGKDRINRFTLVADELRMSQTIDRKVGMLEFLHGAKPHFLSLSRPFLRMFLLSPHKVNRNSCESTV